MPQAELDDLHDRLGRTRRPEPARPYRESWGTAAGVQVDAPLAWSIFPKDIVRPPRRWAQRRFSNIVYGNEVAHGGHFAAFERPATFVEEVRAALRHIP